MATKTKVHKSLRGACKRVLLILDKKNISLNEKTRLFNKEFNTDYDCRSISNWLLKYNSKESKLRILEDERYMKKCRDEYEEDLEEESFIDQIKYKGDAQT